MRKWDHRIHRRHLDEFEFTGERRIAKVGEWVYCGSGSGILSAGECGELITEPTALFDWQIIKWKFELPFDLQDKDGILNHYEAGYMDGYSGCPYALTHAIQQEERASEYPPQRTDEQVDEYLAGYADGENEHFINDISDF